MANVFGPPQKKDFWSGSSANYRIGKRVQPFGTGSELFKNEIKRRGQISNSALLYVMDRQTPGNELGMYFTTVDAAATGTVDWGDGTIEAFTGSGNIVEIYHIYVSAGIVSAEFTFDNPGGVTFFEDDYSDPSDGIGVLFGASMASLTNMLLYNGRFTGVPALPDSLTDIIFNVQPLCSSADFSPYPNLTGHIDFGDNLQLTAVVFNASVKDIDGHITGLASFDPTLYPLLEIVNLAACPNLQTISFNGMQFLDDVDLSNGVFTNITINNAVVRTFGMNLNTVDLTISATGSDIGQQWDTEHSRITSIDFTGVVDAQVVQLKGNKLNTAAVDAVLHAFAVSAIANLTIQIEDQVPPAAPSAAGLADIVTIVGNGGTVTHD